MYIYIYNICVYIRIYVYIIYVCIYIVLKTTPEKFKSTIPCTNVNLKIFFILRHLIPTFQKMLSGIRIFRLCE